MAATWAEGRSASPLILLHFMAMGTSRKFAHDDIVKVIETGETGIVKSFHEDDNGYVYGVQLGKEPATETAVPEDALEPVKIANGDETGFAIRYIS
jgi:hypothetical protein